MQHTQPIGETGFRVLPKSPVNVVSRLFSDSTQQIHMGAVPLVAESPLRREDAKSYRHGGVVAAVGLLLYCAIAWFTDVNFNILIGGGLAVISVGLFAACYFMHVSLAGLERIAGLVWQGEESMEFRTPSAWQSGQRLRYAINPGPVQFQWVATDCRTQTPNSTETIVLSGGLGVDVNKMLAIIRQFTGQAMSGGVKSIDLLDAKIKELEKQAKSEVLGGVRKFAAAKSYGFFRTHREQSGGMSPAEGWQAIMTEANEALKDTPFAIRFLNPVAFIPPPEVAKREDNEAARIRGERETATKLAQQISRVTRTTGSALRTSIGSANIPTETRKDLLDKLQARLNELNLAYFGGQIETTTLANAEALVVEIDESDLPDEAKEELEIELQKVIASLQRQEAAVIDGAVTTRVDELGIEIKAVNALAREGSKYAADVEEYLILKEGRPRQVRAALEIRQQLKERTKPAPASTNGHHKEDEAPLELPLDEGDDAEVVQEQEEGVQK